MRRTKLGIVALSCIVSSAGVVSACCTVSPSGRSVFLTRENVIIVWDEAKKIQHFIREANFDSKADDFGFIVPTPTVPEFGIAQERAFNLLASLIPRPPTKGADAAAGTVSARPRGSVAVLKEEQVGDYKATVLQATDGAAMNAWLKKNGYASRPAMTEWLDGYAKKKWVFTALKYTAADDGPTRTKALRLSFKTDRPHYPYKMPKDTWPEGWKRPLTVFFVAASTYASHYEGTGEGWEAKTEWSGPLPDDRRGELAKNLSLTEGDLPPNARVTVFRNGENPDGYGRDLVFTASTNWTPYLIGGAGVLGLAFLATRKRKDRRPEQIPAPA